MALTPLAWASVRSTCPSSASLTQYHPGGALDGRRVVARLLGEVGPERLGPAGHLSRGDDGAGGVERGGGDGALVEVEAGEVGRGHGGGGGWILIGNIPPLAGRPWGASVPRACPKRRRHRSFAQPSCPEPHAAERPSVLRLMKRLALLVLFVMFGCQGEPRDSYNVYGSNLWAEEPKVDR